MSTLLLCGSHSFTDSSSKFSLQPGQLQGTFSSKNIGHRDQMRGLEVNHRLPLFGQLFDKSEDFTLRRLGRIKRLFFHFHGVTHGFHFRFMRRLNGPELLAFFWSQGESFSQIGNPERFQTLCVFTRRPRLSPSRPLQAHAQKEEDGERFHQKEVEVNMMSSYPVSQRSSKSSSSGVRGRSV